MKIQMRVAICSIVVAFALGYSAGHRYVFSENCFERSCGDLHLSVGDTPFRFTGLVVDRKGRPCTNVFVKVVSHLEGPMMLHTDSKGTVSFTLRGPKIRGIEVDGCVLYEEPYLLGGPSWGESGVNMFVVLDRVIWFKHKGGTHFPAHRE
jgi:hypothetical protein